MRAVIVGVALAAGVSTACRSEPSSQLLREVPVIPSARLPAAGEPHERPTPLGDAEPPGFAFEVVDLTTGRPLQTARATELDAPISPGSVAKVLATLAAVEAGVIDGHMTLVCPRSLRVEGHAVDCVHPDLGHPLTAAEALAQSCNGFFVGVAKRLPRAAFDRALVGAGLAPLSPEVPMGLGVLGLEGLRASARDWRAAFARVVGRALETPGTLAHRTLLEGVRLAATEGTASAFAAHGLSALAKTGTASLAAGQIGGLVVALLPAERPTTAVVGLVAGGSGRDAAALVARALATRPAASTVRVAPEAPRPERVTVRVGRGVGGRLEVEPVALEDYVAGVVAGEAPVAATAALREALAVLARTFALAHWGRHAQEGFDVCDTSHCQVLGAESPVSRAAARASEGMVLAEHDDVARAHYSASCGGSLASPESIWHGHDQRASGGRVGPDPVEHALDRWSADLSRDELEAVIADLGMRGGRVRRVRVADETPGGQVLSLHFEGLSPDSVDAEAFRLATGRRFGWHLLKSSAYGVTETARGLHFDGRGKGHGVGFCVAGASVLAGRGESAAHLLKTYFPGLSLVSLGATSRSRHDNATERPAPVARGGVSVVVPASLVAARAPLIARLERLVRDLEARLGRVGRLPVRLRVHPTRESYARDTGKPWWTSAVQHRDGEEIVVEILPLELLERRGTLESTLAHEVVHALTASALTSRPLWVHEGVAAFFAGEAGVTASKSVPARCPSDAAFTDATSAEALRAAYAESAACVRAALARGLDWRDLGTGAQVRATP
jgi:stage II sporulation protein D